MRSTWEAWQKLGVNRSGTFRLRLDCFLPLSADAKEESSGKRLLEDPKQSETVRPQPARTHVEQVLYDSTPLDDCP